MEIYVYKNKSAEKKIANFARVCLVGRGDDGGDGQHFVNAKWIPENICEFFNFTIAYIKSNI